jgi:hypothetical protein
VIVIVIEIGSGIGIGISSWRLKIVTYIDRLRKVTLKEMRFDCFDVI